MLTTDRPLFLEEVLGFFDDLEFFYRKKIKRLIEILFKKVNKVYAAE